MRAGKDAGARRVAGGSRRDRSSVWPNTSSACGSAPEGGSMNSDAARCSNEGCQKRTRCARFDLDGGYYEDFAIGIDGKCDGYIRKAHKAAVGAGSAAETGDGHGGKVKPWIHAH